jgi:glyoxylate reductase
MKKILITRRIPKIALNLLSKEFDVKMRNENSPLDIEEVASAVIEYDGILSCVSEKFSRDVLEKKGKLAVLSNYAVGLDNIDLDAANQLGIAVYNTPDVVTASTADLTFALLLSLIRRINSAQKYVKENKWTKWDPEIFLGEELQGKTFGIIGFGKIGKEVAARAKGFGLDVIFFNRGKVEMDGCKQVELSELLKNSDYISLHIPLTNETRNFVNSDIFQKMANNPILINMARGGIVDSDALAIALKNGQIRGACLDVTDPEPISGDNQLLQYDNCLIVPHIGTATVDSREAMAKMAAENIIKHFKSDTPLEGDLRNRVIKVFEQLLEIKIDDQISMADPRWDSLKHIQLLAALEKEFTIEMKYEDSMKITDLKSTIAIIGSYIV